MENFGPYMPENLQLMWLLYMLHKHLPLIWMFCCVVADVSRQNIYIYTYIYIYSVWWLSSCGASSVYADNFCQMSAFRLLSCTGNGKNEQHQDTE